MWLGITLLALAGALIWLSRGPGRARRLEGEHARDEEALRDAEDEVRRLDAMTPPDDADRGLSDWGPGAPR